MAALSGEHDSMEGKERLKKEAEHSRLIGVRFKKQSNFVPGLIVGSKMNRSPHPPAKREKFFYRA